MCVTTADHGTHTEAATTSTSGCTLNDGPDLWQTRKIDVYWCTISKC